MKWFKRIARESVGCCRGAAIDHSPGLQPWVRQIERSALKVAPDVRAIGGLNTPFAEHTPRSPLSGRGRVGAFPRAKALGYSLRPFHGQELPESVNVSNH
jgi:hypothetical protein